MSDWPRLFAPVSPILNPWSPEAYGAALNGSTHTMLGNAASTAWPANNQAMYIPFRITAPALVRQLLFMVGGTSSGNIDVGIYDSQKHLIVSSGSTAMSASTNTVQELNVTDKWLNPGEYLLGASCSTTAGTVFGLGSIADELMLPVITLYQEASALPLPATATPVVSTDGTPKLPLIGIQFAATF